MNPYRRLTTLSLLIVGSHNRYLASAWSLQKPTGSSLAPKTEFSRREVAFQWATVASVATLAPLPSLAAVEFSPKYDPNDYNAPRNEGLLSPDKVADILHEVPTFTIVDKKGVPFMVVGEDAKITGYFFTTYEEAERVLNLAKTSADTAIAEAKKEGEQVDENPWNKARISTVPLDSAVTLVSKSINLRNNFFQMAPAVDDIEDALAITGKKDLAEGKVPLFYMKDFMIEDPKDESQKRSPLYFRKSDLEQDFKRLNPGQKMPEILVSELFAVLLEMVKPGGTNEDVKTLTIMPPKGSSEKAKKCLKSGGKQPPFALGERNLIL